MCDCGVFMLKFADFVSRDKAVDFTQVSCKVQCINWKLLKISSLRLLFAGEYAIFSSKNMLGNFTE